MEFALTEGKLQPESLVAIRGPRWTRSTHGKDGCCQAIQHWWNLLLGLVSNEFSLFSVSRHLTNLKMYPTIPLKLSKCASKTMIRHETHPVVADASSHVLIFWLQGNGFGDKNRTLVRSVQSMGKSGSPWISSTSWKRRARSEKRTINKKNKKISRRVRRSRRPSPDWRCAERPRTIWRSRPGNARRRTPTGWTRSGATVWTGWTRKRCRRRRRTRPWPVSTTRPPAACSWRASCV